MPSPRNTKKKAKSSHSESTKGRKLTDILGESRALKAWLRPGKGARQEVFIILAEGLSPKDREVIAGTADLVVDITTTGETLRANGLRILDDGVILKSEANLVLSNAAPWDTGTTAARDAILSRVAP